MAMEGGKRAVRSLHVLCAGFGAAYFAAGTVTDIAYLRTAEMQWSNFSAWLIVGGLVFTGVALGATLLALALHLRGGLSMSRMIEAAALALAFVLGLINAFKHSQDAWSSVGSLGLFLSIASSIAAVVAVFALSMRPSLREVGQ
jgi:uncharacterized membrane protein